MNTYLRKTPLLDFAHPSITTLVSQRKWDQLPVVERVKQVYNFVRDEIAFGYNIADNIAASEVLADGYGQCNTKATLLMALLRATGVPCRIHGFTIDKALQKGAITGLWYRLSPKNILHTWVEVYVNDDWYFMEGVILDKTYLNALQQINKDCKTTFCGYGVYTNNFAAPQVNWHLNHTYIQREGINKDFGLFDAPDDLYKQHRQALSPLKKFLFQNVIRHSMNRNVQRIRTQVSLPVEVLMAIG